jgi:hypothetical protein
MNRGASSEGIGVREENSILLQRFYECRFLTLAIIAFGLFIPLFFCPTAAHADDGGTDGGITWSYAGSTGTMTISAAETPEDDYASGTMPDQTSGSQDWADYISSIQNIVVEEGVTYIGDYAFTGCVMKSIELPETLVEIGDFAFSPYSNRASAQLTTLTIPASVESIRSYAFYGNSALQSVMFEDESDLSIIEDNAFGSCFYNVSEGTECVFDMSGCKTTSFSNYYKHTNFLQDGNGVTSSESLTVILPANLETIDCVGFTKKTINTMVVPSSLTGYEFSSFTDCSLLSNIELLPDADAGISSLVNANEDEESLSASLLSSLGDGKALGQVRSVGSLSSVAEIDTWLSSDSSRTVTVDLSFTGSEQPTVYYISDGGTVADVSDSVTGSVDEGWTLQIDSTAAGVYATVVDALSAEGFAELQSAASSAEALLSSVVVSEDGTDVAIDEKWVTQDVYDALQSAVDDANELLSSISISEEDGAAALTALEEAMSDFSAAATAGTDEVTSAQISRLNIDISAGNALLNSVTVSADGTDVDASSKWVAQDAYDALKSAVAAASAVLSDSSATGAEATSAAAALEDAIAAFKAAMASGTNGVSLAKGKTFTVKTAAGTFKYRVTSKGKVTLVRATKTKAKKVTINTVEYNGYTYKVTAIAKGAFKGAKTKKVVIGANVKTVGARAFASAKKLAAVTIGKNVKKVGARAFSKAKKLKKITVKSKKLTKKSTVKNCLKGSKVKTVKLSKLGSKKAKVKRAFKKYAGKKGVVVK